ncbi:hypothetical protein ACFLWR_02585 [Chloroflexota bacterium]
MNQLKQKSLPKPVDALNLVYFADEISYRWYELLLAPLVLALGGRPVWVGIHEMSLSGDKQADEIVIIRYPTHSTILRVISSRYYSLVNGLRKKGVRYMEFSLTERQKASELFREKGFSLLVHHNNQGNSESSPLPEIQKTLESLSMRLIYASRETATLSIFNSREPTDPNPSRYKNTAIFTFPKTLSPGNIINDDLLKNLKAVTESFSLQVYRPLRYLEAMPWAKRNISG